MNWVEGHRTTLPCFQWLKQQHVRPRFTFLSCLFHKNMNLCSTPQGAILTNRLIETLESSGLLQFLCLEEFTLRKRKLDVGSIGYCNSLQMQRTGSINVELLMKCSVHRDEQKIAFHLVCLPESDSWVEGDLNVVLWLPCTSRCLAIHYAFKTFLALWGTSLYML